jgi:hypothetical protein
MVEKEVSTVLTDSKVLLQFALAAVVEALRTNPDKYNNLLAFDRSSSSTTISTQQSPPSWHIEDYKDILLEEANRLYVRLLKHFTQSIWIMLLLR